MSRRRWRGGGGGGGGSKLSATSGAARRLGQQQPLEVSSSNTVLTRLHVTYKKQIFRAGGDTGGAGACTLRAAMPWPHRSPLAPAARSFRACLGSVLRPTQACTPSARPSLPSGGTAMCGILAALGVSGDAEKNRRDILKLSRLLRHRGPDQNSVYQAPDGRAFICFERLMIVDPTESGRRAAQREGVTHMPLHGTHPRDA